MLSIRKGLAFLLVAAMAVTGCSSSKTTEPTKDTPAANKAPVKITFWHGMADDSAHGKVMKQLVDQFNKEHPDIVVEATYQGSYTQLEQKLTSALAAQTPPTLVQNTDSMLTNLVRAKAVQPLDSLVPADQLSDYIPALMQTVKYDGKLYALPFNKSAVVLFYDKKLIPTPPKNWDEFHQMAVKATVKGKMAGTAFAADVYTFQQHLQQAGGQFLDDKGQPAFNSDAGDQALQLIVDMIKDGSAQQMKAGEYQSDYINQGRAAMVATTTASLAYIKSPNPTTGDEIGVAPLFQGPKGAAVPLSGANISIVNGIKPEEAKAAATFLVWLTGPQAQLTWGKGMTGYGPVRTSVLNSADWKSFVQQHPEYGILSDALTKGTVQPAVKNWQAVQNLITTAVAKAALGQADAKTALNDAAKAAVAELAK